MKPLYRYSFADVEPVRSVASGEIIEVSFPDSDGLGADLTPLPAELFEQSSPTLGNPVYGPIAISGAQPGDSIRIDFLKITPSRSTARTLLDSNHGFLPDTMLGSPEAKPRHMYHWEVEGDIARLANPLGSRPVQIPVRPFLGCVATAVATPTSSLLAYSHGGNIDHPDLVAGTTLWLPVAVPGALLYLGDIHAAQGHGETAGGGLEISGTAQIRLSACPGTHLVTPRYRTSQGIASLATGRNFDSAARSAQASIIHWLAASGWHLFDAQMLIAQTCEFRVGGLTKDYAVVSCFIAHEHCGSSEDHSAC